MAELAANIIEAREQLGMSQRALAGQAGISSAYLSQIEAGSKLPSLDVLEELAKSLHLTAGVLLDQGLQRPDGLPSVDAIHGARALSEIEQEVRSPAACMRLVNDVQGYLDGPLGNRLGAYRRVAETYRDILEEFARGKYRSLSGSAIVVITAALSYLVDPDDVWPDAHPHGHVDDLAILAFTRGLVADDLKDFRRWRERQEDSSFLEPTSLQAPSVGPSPAR